METDERPLLLTIGTDRYVLDACVRLGIDAVVVYGSSSHDDGLVSIPEELTPLRVDEQNSAEAILMALHRAGLADRRFSGVQTTDEWSLVTASLLARHLGCAFIDPATAVHFRDKSLQKRRVAAAGIRAARVEVIDDIHDVSAIAEMPFPKAVLKPVAGAATSRTTVVHTMEELADRSREYRAQPTSQRTFVLEEYISGDEWVADGVMYDGELHFCALGTYGNPCLTTVDQQLPLWIRRFDRESEAWAYDLGLPIVERALVALGLHDGVFHMELFHDPVTGDLTFSECAARRGGGLVHEEVQAKFNVNLCEGAVLTALGRRPDLDVKERPEFVAGGYLLSRAGVMIGCPTASDLMALPGVEFARIDRPYGTRFGGGIASTNERIGQFLVAADSVDALTTRMAEVRAWFDERLVLLPPGASARELRAWQRATYPAADFGDTLWS